MGLFAKIKTNARESLLWSQKYTRTDMLYLTRGMFWLQLGDVIASLIVFVTAIAFANLVPKETFGTYKYVIAIAGLLGAITLPGMGTAITRAIARGFEGTFVPAVKTTVRWSLLGGLAAIITSGYYFYQGNTIIGTSLLIIAAFIPFKDSLALYQSFVQGKKQFQLSTIYSTSDQLISGGILLLAIFFSSNLFLILLAYFIPKVGINLFFYLRTTSMVDKKSPEDPDAISYGKHLSFIGILGDVSSQLDKIFVWNHIGALPLALYSFALAPVIQGRSFLTNVFPLAVPKLAQQDIKTLKQTLPRKIGIMFLGLVVVVIAYILAAPTLFHLFFPQYTDSIFYSQIFALSLLFLPKNILTSTVTLHAPRSYIYILNVSSSLIRISLLAFLVYSIGILGAILAYIGTDIYVSVLGWYIVFQKL